LGIANSLTQQINSSNQGIRNLNDGISMVQTAEGALSAASEMSQRILTLATQGANSNLSSDQRKAIGNEMKSLWASIGKIESRTKFSGTSLLANTTAITVQSSGLSADTISITTAAIQNIWIGSVTGNTAVSDMYTAVVTDAGGASPTTAHMTAVMDKVDDYITYLDTQRTTLGAIQNQMEFAVNNISELSANLTSARSRIVDTDYASETASLTKGQILQQAATAMLAQANQMPNVILSLLK